jgi:hypothetical protein
MIYDTLRWEQTAGLVVVFKRSGADIALAAAGVLAPGVLALLAASVLEAFRTARKRGAAPTTGTLSVLDEVSSVSVSDTLL